jgi:predicted DNA-binding transcriptional regulator AlpA
MNQQKPQRLPAFPPRGLRRPDAAAYVGVSPTKFDEWVSRGVMPGPKRIDGVVIWDLRTLDLAFDALPSSSLAPEADIWDSVAT